MPRLPNDRNEQYARYRARGMSAAKAALAAGYASGSSTTHLENDAEIQQRIAEVGEEMRVHREQQQAAAKAAAQKVGEVTGFGRGWVIQQLAENAQNAAREGAFKESNEALKLIGEEFGMFQGQQNDDGSNGSAVPQTLNMDAIEAVIGEAHDALPGSAKAPSVAHDEAVALDLIRGQTKADTERRSDEPVTETPPVDDEAVLAALDDLAQADLTPIKKTSNRLKPGARKLSTGSETDAAIPED